MPIRDQSGKELSGAAKRKLKREKDEEVRKREAERKKQTGAPGRNFNELPPAPLGDPLKAMGWWNDVLLVCADNVLRDPLLPLEQRVRLLADFSAKAGMIRDKAAETKAIREALKEKDQKKEAAGLEDASGSPPPEIPRPPE